MTKPMPRLLSALCTLAVCVHVQAQAFDFDIAAGEMKAALDAFARQSGTQLIYRSEDVKGLSSKGLKRSLPADAALGLLLDGTPLKMRRDVSGAVVIFADPPLPPRPDRPERTGKRANDSLGTGSAEPLDARPRSHNFGAPLPR